MSLEMNVHLTLWAKVGIFFCQIYVSTDLVAVCTVEEGVAWMGSAADDQWRGWAVYHLAHTEDAATASITAAVAPMTPLQSHAHTALTHATVLIAEV